MSNKELLNLENISKSFGVVKALDSVSFSVYKGEIHGIVGENGAGKSTLANIILGNLYPDKGTIIFNNSELKTNNPRIANELGVSMVHQELSIFDNLTVAENIFPMHNFTNKYKFIDSKLLNENAVEQLKLFSLDIKPKEKMINLSLAEQQIVEIIRAISSNPKLIILDEPTSALNSKEVENLFQILKQLQKKSIVVLYISHHLSEILNLCNRVTVLKDGKYVDTLNRDEISTEKDLIRLMVGKDLENLYAKKNYYNINKKEVFMELKNVNRNNSVQDVSFKLYKNEILGIYGLEGAGRTELSKILFGLDNFDSGSIVIEGEEVNQIKPNEAIKKGIIYLNKNRKKAGLFPGMYACDNIICPILDKVSSHGFLDKNEIKNTTEKFIEELNIIISNITNTPKQLSGGNQQKLMVATCLGTAPKCIIANEPTRGIDVGSKAEIHKILKELAGKGASIILISSELPETISLCDRALVMYDHKIVGELSSEEITEEAVITLATGNK